MRWPRQAASLLAVAALLAGPPVLLTEWVGWPWDRWPDSEQARLWLREPLTEQNLTGLLVVLAWLLWAFVAYTAAVRVAVRVWAGVRWLRRLPLPTPWQATATGMAGAAAFTAGAHTSTPAVEAPVDPVVPATDTQDTFREQDRDGVAVTGGWLPYDVAEQVTAAASLWWLRRRRAYQPTPAQATTANADLAPLPPTVAAVQAATRTAPAPGPDPDPATVPAVTGPLSAQLPRGGVGLTGPGAYAAARGILVTTLLAGLRHPERARGVVITRTAVETLFGPAADGLRPGPGLRITSTTDDAAALLPPPHSHRPYTSTSPDEMPVPYGAAGSVVIMEGPPQGRLAASLADCQATAIVLALWPGVPTWHVEATGHARDLRHPADTELRLCVLDPVAATDLLAVAGHTDHTHRTAVSDAPQQRQRALVPRQASRHPPPAADPGWRLRVLGEPALFVNGTPVAVRRSAALQALAFLAVHNDGATSRQLTEALWPGLPAHRVTSRLYTTLSHLRATARTTAGAMLVEHVGDRYRLHPDHVDVDLWHLHTAIDHATTTLTTDSRPWQAIIDAYPADLASGQMWPWIEPHREALRRHVLDAYAALAAAEPDPRQALARLQDGIRVDPYNEQLHRRAVDILTDLGDHEAATNLSDRYARRLTDAGLHPDHTFRVAGHPTTT
ncbi:DNA-binding transcriptional activator of the SARP family [Micromonospora nigra]|uniref:DNA-binding transcriptional activator of the SARP family n=1 Tax=Micromonospora nigra TaxID=145857 RepID=A0A1C6S9P6_9ACTN|nr:BTAD domain-containing putative transcriptional regulator [Micromonospora nigra]SCL26002.1 DNA-binding transcriptional activator of the SARP family [Micromonospora nigra]